MNTTRIPADLEAIQSRRLQTQEEIDSGRSAQERNKLGQFATPPTLACAITQEMRQWIGSKGIRFGEPSIGTGSFYNALLTTFEPEQILSAVGVEIDPVFAAAARNLWKGTGLQIVPGDFTLPSTQQAAQPRPNVILANPPYVRHHHMDAAQKERLRDASSCVAGVKVSGLAGLYVHFVLLAHDWLEDDGLAAWLIPSEFMEVNYGSALREYLSDRVTLLRIHRFDPAGSLFDDALVSSVVVIYRKRAPEPGTCAQFTFGASLSHPDMAQEVPLETLRASRKWTAFPSSAPSAPATQGATETVLGDLFRVRRGIATGGNDFFIMPRSRAVALGLPETALRPILPSPRGLRGVQVVERGDTGYPALPVPLAVLDCDLPEREIEQQYPALWRYLCQGVADGVSSGYLCSKRRPWYRQEQRTSPLFVSTYMGRSGEDGQPFRFILNRSDAIVANMYLGLEPIGALAALLKRQPGADVEVLTLLNEITGAELKAEGRAYGGGLHKVEPKELARLPVRALTERFPDLAKRPASLF